MSLHGDGGCVAGWGLEEEGVVQEDTLISAGHPARYDRGNVVATMSWVAERSHGSYEAACVAGGVHAVDCRGVGTVTVWPGDGVQSLVMTRASVTHRQQVRGVVSYHTYSVRGLMSAVSGAVLLAPVLTGTVDGYTALWEWTAVAGAEAYRFYIKVGGGAWELFFITSALGTDSGEYEFGDGVYGKVAAVMPGGVEGPVSNTVLLIFTGGALVDAGAIAVGGEAAALGGSGLEM